MVMQAQTLFLRGIRHRALARLQAPRGGPRLVPIVEDKTSRESNYFLKNSGRFPRSSLGSRLPRPPEGERVDGVRHRVSSVGFRLRRTRSLGKPTCLPHSPQGKHVFSMPVNLVNLLFFKMP